VFLPVSTALILMLEGSKTFLVILSAVLLHEFGHFFFIKLCGAKITRVDIEVLGALIVYDYTDLNADIAISLGGIIFNLVSAAVGIGFFILYKNLYLLIFICANFAFAFFNLLPIANLDGGRALNAYLLKKKDIDVAEKVSGSVSLGAKIFLILLSAVMIYLSGFNTAMIFLFLLNLIQLNN
jgi:membrane-associated protease RseP (regulator of RpoE activity)